jgi:hypothetical protein
MCGTAKNGRCKMTVWVYKRGESIADKYVNVMKRDVLKSGEIIKIVMADGGAMYPIDIIDLIKWDN